MKSTDLVARGTNSGTVRQEVPRHRQAEPKGHECQNVGVVTSQNVGVMTSWIMYRPKSQSDCHMPGKSTSLLWVDVG